MSSLKIPDLSFLNKERNSGSKNYNNKYDYSLTLGMLTAFFTILLVFLLFAINNIWVFIGFFTSIALVVMWHSIVKNKSMTPVIIIILVGTSIILWQYRKMLFYKNTKENFYTLFKPYQPYPGEKPYTDDINTVALSNTTNTTSNLLNYRMKPLLFGYQFIDNKITTYLSKLLLSRSKVANVSLKLNDSYEDLCKKLDNYSLDIAIVPSPIVHRAFMGYLSGIMKDNKPHQKMKNLQFIANVQHQYLFCISSIKSGVQNIHQLRNKRVGIPPRLKNIWLDIEKSIFPNGHSIKFTFDNEYKLIQDLADFKLDVVFYAGEYPNTFINKVINSEINHSYQLIPIILRDEKAFLAKNPHYRKNILSLTYNYLPSIYLPSGVDRRWQDDYTPDYPTIGFDLALICNNKLDDFTGYEIAKTIFFGRKLLLRNTSISHLVYIGDPFTPADITNPSLPDLQVQNGSKEFYISKGLISYCKDPICMTTVGISRCTACDKKEPDYETNMQWNDRIIGEKIMKLY